jgi:4'-phosphopantetheinyl transferase
MRELRSDQIHLWMYRIGVQPDARRLAAFLPLLDETERQRCARFHFEKHRAQFALSHAMLRLALSEYAPVRPGDWRFATGEWGKPEIGGPPLDSPLWFNLSHTDGFAACVIGRVPRLGVDVENINRITPCDELAQHFFAATEYEYVRALPQDLLREAFFRIWTLKEAYIKAEGKGLAIPLDSFYFRLSDHTAELAPGGESNPDAWSFFEFQPGPDHRIAIGAENAGSGCLSVQQHDAALLFDRDVNKARAS